ncbi:MAG: family 20 glycosylhydrolase [Bacteroidetes bacterium]|nr:family 20 glycosylhydrolase [Bacteroidota bacterium]MCL5738062.1 family 20 glycosylhydrolase [Bacteroidota bacterium]
MYTKFFLFQLLILAFTGSALMAEVHVLPTPKFVHEKDTKIQFGKVSADFSKEADDEAARDELAKYFGKNLRKGNKAQPNRVLITARIIDENTKLDTDIPPAIRDSVLSLDGGYFLHASDRHIKVLARTKTGIFYGVVTLLQLVEKEKAGYDLKEVTIADYPSMKMRGISDDISRGQISTTENFKKIIRFIAMYKMNIYMPYIENEFAFKSYPDFSKGRAPLTAEEVTELDKYAKLYHVQMIPIFETLGHMEDVLQKPEFEKYAEFPGATCVDVSNDSAYVFLESLLSDIAPAFSSKYFNMAADESWDVGRGASKHLVDSLGLAEVNAQHYKKVYDILKSLGKNVMMYGDIILNNPEVLSEIPKDITIVDWHYGASFDYPSVQVFKNAGFNFIVSPAVWNFTGPFPNFYNTYANIQYFTEEGYKAGTLGVIVSTWNDNGGAELRELNYPGYAWGAECAWNPTNASPAHFEKIFFHQYFRTKSDLPRIAYELLSSTNNQIGWYEFWRSPFVSKADNQVALRSESIESTIPEVLSLIKNAREVVGANKDILDLYGIAAKMDKYWADRVLGVKEMRDICSDSMVTPRSRSERVKSIEEKLLISIESIKNEYTKLYLRTNRYPMLQLLEDRFVDQEKALESGTKNLLAGNCNYNQLLTSSFVYYPASRPYTREKDKVDSATFVKTFDLSEVPEHAEAQLIGDTYCNLFINGKFVGEVKGRRTLTLNVEMQRVKVFDIRKFLREGKNTFVVQSANYDPNGSVGCNIFAEIGHDTLATDTSWKVAKGIFSPDDLDKAQFVNAAEYNNGWTVSAPDFSLKLKSWIER